MEIIDIKGFGEKRIGLLKDKGLVKPLDLCNFLPKKYVDLTFEIDSLEPYVGREVLFVSELKKNPTSQYFGKKNLTKVEFEVGDKKVYCTFFNQPYIKSNFTQGEEYRVCGLLVFSKGKFSMISPKFEKNKGEVKLCGIFPQYSKMEGISNNLIQSAIKDILLKSPIESIIPIEIESQNNLISLREAYEFCHFPKTLKEAELGRNRVNTENSVRAVLSYETVREKGNQVYNFAKSDLKSIWLPYALTQSQERAIIEALHDINSQFLMNRLLQGDVGSGKTLVMMTLATMLAKKGQQVAILCPTTTLAEQHFKNYQVIAKRNGINCVLLTSKNSDKKILTEISTGTAKVVIGTHSLFSNKTIYKNLSLAIIDEQQKFGVNQRQALLNKGDAVHVLSATATPIPRTLSLMLYGEINISYLDNEIAQKNINTHILSYNRLGDLLEFVKERLKQKEKAYFVAPKVNETDENEGAIGLYNDVKIKFNGFNVGLLHGGLGVNERDCVTRKFEQNFYDILVSTSLIEVGIDNKDASMMIIFQAENFGLSQLHQLRGRVGRRGQQSYCFVLPKNFNEKTKPRLEIFKNTLDGFKIADFDLQNRGGGDAYGTSQHGDFEEDAFKLKFEDVKTIKLLADKVKLYYKENQNSIILYKKLDIKKIGRLN